MAIYHILQTTISSKQSAISTSTVLYLYGAIINPCQANLYHRHNDIEKDYKGNY